MNKPIEHMFMSENNCKCRIKSLAFVEGQESFYLSSTPEESIQHITKSGHMASLDWYYFNNMEVNGSFVASIVYEDEANL